MSFVIVGLPPEKQLIDRVSGAQWTLLLAGELPQSPKGGFPLLMWGPPVCWFINPMETIQLYLDGPRD